MKFKEDKGKDFGKWSDPVSRFIYFDSMKKILPKIGEIKGTVADYGGANGNLKEFIPGAISIDIDPSKDPDVVDNIITHEGVYDLVIIRYVLHYLNDYQVIQLFENIKSKRILVIQFVNHDLRSKYYNSKNEFKYFRTAEQMNGLLPEEFDMIHSDPYIVNEEFYKNRLGIEDSVPHLETLKAYYYEKK